MGSTPNTTPSKTGTCGKSPSASAADKVYRRILLSRGEVVSLRLIQQTFRGSLRAAQILEAMETLSREGLGYVMQDSGGHRAKYFHKMAPDSVKENPQFHKYLISLCKYTESYFYDKPAANKTPQNRSYTTTFRPAEGITFQLIDHDNEVIL